MAMRRQPIPEDVAHRIYDILVKHVPLSEHPDDLFDGIDHWRYTFIRYAIEGTWTEYRIGGPLGFGGKVWFNGGRWYVTYYPEDETPARELAVQRTNKALAELLEEVTKEADS